MSNLFRGPSQRLRNPIFIIAMPRSGSTLLFDLLRAHEDVLTWGDEAYPPWQAVDPQVASGELGDSFRPGTITHRAGLRASKVFLGGIAAEEKRRGKRRLRTPIQRWLWQRSLLGLNQRVVEKTPANVIRVGALDALFLNPTFIFLTRDAPANIASLLEGRERGLAIRDWPRRNNKEWHFLMPPGWMEHLDTSPAEQFAWQWQVGNQRALDDLSGKSYVHVRYENLVADPIEVMGRVVRQTGLMPSPGVARAAEEMAPSKHTLSAPRDDKWREREAEITPVLPALAPLRRALGYDVVS